MVLKRLPVTFLLFPQTRALCGDDLFIWSGNDDNTLPMMALGGNRGHFRGFQYIPQRSIGALSILSRP